MSRFLSVSVLQPPGIRRKVNKMVLNFFTIVILIALAALICVAVAFLGLLPGRIAKHRNHPQAEAINVASWLGIITAGALWPFALIWAYYRPREHPVEVGSEELAELKSRVEALEERVGRDGGTP